MQRFDIASGLVSGPQITKFTLTTADLTTAATTQTITLLANPGGNAANPANFTVPQGGVLMYARIHHTTAFTGGGLSSMTVSLGKSGGSNTFATSAFNIFQTAADGTLQETWNVSSAQNSAWTPTLTFISIGGNVSAATAGSVDVYLYYFDISTPSA